MTHLVALRIQASSPAREETFLGRAFRVIPAVLVRSQILRNNLGVTYLPEDTITDEWANLWNGIPVLVGPHPSENGKAVSGRTPQLWDERGAGWIFHARAEQEAPGIRRLSAEIWLDVERAATVNGLQAALDRVAAGRPVELSTGFAAEIESTQGVHNGLAYEAIMRPAGADHLVISTEMTGACSVADGCGLGVNEMYTQDPPATVVSPKRKPTMDASQNRFKAILERAGALFAGRQDKGTERWETNVAHSIAREMEVLNAITPSDQERANMICEDLQDAFGSADKQVVVTDVYSDLSLVVFWFMTPFGPDPAGAEFYRVGFTGGEGGEYKFEGTPVRVRRMTSYEPVAAENAANAGAGNGTKPCGCGTHGTTQEDTMQESDKKEIGLMLAGLLEPLTTRLNAVEASAKTAAEGVVNAAVAEFKAGLAALTTKIDEVSATAKAAATVANADKEAERKELVTELSTNVKTKELYSAADLEAKPLDELRKIAQLAAVEVVNYSGRGGPRTPVTNSAELAFAPVVPYFAKKDAPAATTNKTGE